MSRQRSNPKAKGGAKPTATGAGTPEEKTKTRSRGQASGHSLSAAAKRDTVAYNADSKDKDALSGQVGNKPADQAGADKTQTPKPEASKPVDNKPETSKADSTKSGSDKSEPVKSTAAKATGSSPGAAKPAPAQGGGGAGRTPPPPSGGQSSGRNSKLPLIVGGVAVVLALGIGMNASSNANKAMEMANEANDRLSSALRELAEIEERTQALPETISRMETQVSELEGDVRTELEKALEEARTELASIEERQQRRLETLEEGLGAIQNESERPHREWQAAEVTYLLGIADHRLNLMDDPTGAIAALKSADTMLQAMGDPKYSEVRDAIAEEIAALEGYEGSNVQEIVAALDEIVEELKPLPLQKPETESGGRLSLVNGDAPNGDSPWWERAYYQVVSELNQQVTVRRHDQVVRSMPDADAELFMRQALALRIESARLAALRDNEDEYRENLQSARAMLAEYFASEPVAPLMKRLEDLEKRDLRPEQPEIGKSAELLAELEG
ncbi:MULTISPECIES: uroporphyrinogen-III C-methyltransferase [unclassified Ectothiorhodospira]|uniref:uroporphyrinogen-III C-methyltransferase n=1 Tax=unclassified Ectothiorhodospira TaxID=2684909 RepID=UPI001EE82C67|nr:MULTISPECIES: uroporphyrinogen-III C-methyltransferase [unclassified Ectothiorhodospira]MCG5516937.1 uroporphyrinogen-III C-methyltransferase [Ectothiorhodospira sp. 9100]MCG5518175.1 uroporphyrinogen-III C-methyltransferase [Ectothiorhodospira sp. 9905]